MSQTTISLGKKIRHSRSRQRKSFSWLGLFLVIAGLGCLFYFIGPTDINKTYMPKESSSFLGGTSGTFKS